MLAELFKHVHTMDSKKMRKVLAILQKPNERRNILWTTCDSQFQSCYTDFC